MVLVLLPVVGVTISNAYEKHMLSSMKNELSAFSYAILAVAEVEQQSLQMPEYLLENQFNVSESGLYAFFTSSQNSDKANDENSIVWRSQSLITIDLPPLFAAPDLGENRFDELAISNQPHLIYSQTIAFADEDAAPIFTLHVVKSMDQSALLINEFKQKLWLGLFFLMLVLLVMQFVWLKWSLKPLATLKRELVAIENGDKASLNANYPDELLHVTTQLNALLKSEQQQRQRYRNALSDLAHSLKTPLAVLKSQMPEAAANEQLDTMNRMIEHQLTRAQSVGQVSWLLGTKIAPCLQKLTGSLQKIYAQKALIIKTEVSADALFKGDEADLLEILGNLSDNACKAAQQTILITVKNSEKALAIVVEDDGQGVAQAMREQILQRGTRADTYQQGHGVGLAIVRDIVASYQGELVIGDSSTLGGAKFTVRFGH